MCSVDPDEVTEMTHATECLDVSSGEVLCRKCGTEQAEVVLRAKDAYCRSCFLSYFIHKFRSTIGKSKQIRPGDKVLVVVSGDPSSVALCHLIREGLDENTHKKLRFEPVFLYVDESCLSEEPSVGTEFVNRVCQQVTMMNLSCYVAEIQQVMTPHTDSLTPVLYTQDWSEKSCSPNEDYTAQIQKLFRSCKSPSAQLDLYEQLRLEVICQCAETLGYRKLFFPDNSTRLSVDILANVAMGRGSQLQDKVHFKSTRHGLELFRPMREILENEIDSYINIQGLTTLHCPSFKPQGTTITSCTEEFVFGLQKDFPATVPTIFRTGDKLVSFTNTSTCSTPDLVKENGCDSQISSSIEYCLMCGSHLDTIQSEASAFYATQVSQRLSCNGPASQTREKVISYKNSNDGGTSQNQKADFDNSENISATISSTHCERSGGGCNSEQSESKNWKCCGKKSGALLNNVHGKLLSKEAIEPHICYGCRVILRDMVDLRHLPVRLQESVAQQQRRKEMREQIQDFLL